MSEKTVGVIQRENLYIGMRTAEMPVLQFLMPGVRWMVTM